MLERNENMYLQKTFTQVFKAALHIMFMNRWTYRQSVYPHSGILFGNENKWATDTCYFMDEPQKHDSKREEDRYKRTHIICDSICMKSQKQEI